MGPLKEMMWCQLAAWQSCCYRRWGLPDPLQPQIGWDMGLWSAACPKQCSSHPAAYPDLLPTAPSLLPLQTHSTGCQPSCLGARKHTWSSHQRNDKNKQNQTPQHQRKLTFPCTYRQNRSNSASRIPQTEDTQLCTGGFLMNFPDHYPGTEECVAEAAGGAWKSLLNPKALPFTVHLRK